MGKTIIFCAGAPDPYLDILHTQQYDILVGVDGGAKVLHDQGYRMDYAIGDFDTVPMQVATHVIALPQEKDDTDLEYALQYVLKNETEESVDEIIILGSVNGGRLDHLIANMWLMYQPRFIKWIDKVTMLEKNHWIRFYKPGKYVIEKKSFARYVSVIGMTEIEQLTLENVKYTLFEKSYAYPPALISNEFLLECDTMTLTFQKGLVCIMQTQDTK